MSVNIVHSDGTLEKIAGLGVPGPQGPKGDPGSGSVVEVTQVLSSGTKIAEIDVDGDVKELFAPTGGSGSGDMLASVYDPDGNVAEAGGIEEYVEAHGGGGTVVDNSGNYIFVAHRGHYGNGIVENTAEAFIKAVEIGYKWAEIDLRNTKDNIIVAAHDVRMNLYKNGTSSSISIAEKTFAELQEYSYDPEGTKHVETLSYILYKLKSYDLTFIFDIKVTDITAACFATAYSYGYSKKVVVSCGLDWALSNLDVINTYKDTPIRIYPSNYDKCKQIIEGVQNEVYFDGGLAGVDVATYANRLYPKALALHRPTLVAMFDSATADHRKYMINSIAGFMTDTPKTIEQMKGYTYRNVTMSDITADKTDVLVSSDPQAITAQNSTSGGGYINFYTTNPEIATVEVGTIGESSTAQVSAQSLGKCNLVIQNATIRKTIPVSSAPDGFFQVCELKASGITTSIYTKACLIWLTNDESEVVPMSSAYQGLAHRYNLYGFNKGFAFPQIPSEAETLNVSFNEDVDGRAYITFYDSNKSQLSAHSWAATHNLAIPAGAKYLYLAIKYNDGREINPYNDAEKRESFSNLIDALNMSYS